MEIRIANLEDTPQLMELFDGSLRNMAALQHGSGGLYRRKRSLCRRQFWHPMECSMSGKRMGGCWAWRHYL